MIIYQSLCDNLKLWIKMSQFYTLVAARRLPDFPVCSTLTLLSFSNLSQIDEIVKRDGGCVQTTFSNVFEIKQYPQIWNITLE